MSRLPLANSRVQYTVQYMYIHLYSCMYSTLHILVQYSYSMCVLVELLKSIVMQCMKYKELKTFSGVCQSIYLSDINPL